MPNAHHEIDAAEFARWLREGKAHRLVDVRDDDELELASVAGVLHIPMEQVPQRLDEIPRDEPVVVMCHYGGRSARVAGFLVASGFSDVYNLEGGIEAYALHIDPSIGRY